jgi:large subunit ribosomal protein L6
MSRIGRMPIALPAGVEVTVAADNVVTVKGKLGTLTEKMSPRMTIKVEGNTDRIRLFLFLHSVQNI